MGPLSLLVAAVGLALVPAQAGDGGAGVRIGEVDTGRHPEIAIEVTVTGDVSADDIASTVVVEENGDRIPVVDVEPATSAGMEIVLVVDGSGSMRGAPLDAARAAAHAFVDGAPTGVRIGVVTFGSVPAVLAAPTRDRDRVHTAIDGLQADGETALYDAVRYASLQFSDRATVRRLVLLSDGGDTVSVSTLADAVDATRSMTVDVVELVTDESNRANLDGLATEGDVRSISDPALLPALYEEIASTLSRQVIVHATSAATGRATLSVSLEVGGVTVSDSSAVRLPDADPVAATEPPATEPTTAAPSATTVAAAPEPATTEDDGGGAVRWLGAALVVAAVALFVLTLRSGPTRAEIVRGRLAAASTVAEAPPRRTLGSAVEDALERRGRLADLQNALRKAGMTTGPAELVLLTGVAMLLLFVILTLLVHPLVGLVVALLVPFVTRAVVRRRIAKRREAFVRQLPDVLQLIQSMLTSGFGLLQALKATSEQVAEPARSLFAQAMFAARSGRDISDALRDAATEMESSDFDWVVTAIEINREIGGDLSTILASVAEGVRERQRLRGQVKALTAEGRLSAYVMLALPPGVLAVSAMANPDYASQLFRGAGLVLLAIALALMGLGYVWMKRMIDKVMG